MTKPCAHHHSAGYAVRHEPVAQIVWSPVARQTAHVLLVREAPHGSPRLRSEGVHRRRGQRQSHRVGLRVAGGRLFRERKNSRHRFHRSRLVYRRDGKDVPGYRRASDPGALSGGVGVHFPAWFMCGRNAKSAAMARAGPVPAHSLGFEGPSKPL